MKHFYIFFILVATSLHLQGQEIPRKVLKGKIVANSSDLEGINIINQSADLSTVSQSAGYFSIPVKAGDSVLVSAVQFKSRIVVIRNEDMEKPLFFIQIEALSRQLDEVKINEYKNINAVSLGIIPKGQRKYTPAERKLATAGELHWYSPLLIPVGGMSVDGLINSMSGRTAMLRKELLVERKEILMKKIKEQFEPNYFTETLKIPIDYLDGFQYYLVENQELADAINQKNKVKATFIMNRLALEYLTLLNAK